MVRSASPAASGDWVFRCMRRTMSARLPASPPGSGGGASRGTSPGRQTLLLCTSDPLTLLPAAHPGRLAGAFVFPCLPAGLASALANKREFFYLASREGVPTPEAMFPRAGEEILEFAARATFPVMLKGLDPRLPQGKRNILVQREEELRRHVAGVPADMHPNLRPGCPGIAHPPEPRHRFARRDRPILSLTAISASPGRSRPAG